MQDRNTGFIDIDSIPAFQPVPGCNLRTPHGKQLMLSQVKMEEGAVIPLHRHPHEQGGVVISGKMELQIGYQTRLVSPGELYLIPSNVPHRAVAIDGPVVALDVFSPIRQDYVELSNQYIPGQEMSREPDREIADHD